MYILNELKTGIQAKTCKEISIAALFTIVKRRELPNAH
jgi:hypothetical protein